MKNKFLKCGLYLLRGIMSFIYFFIKLFPMQKNRIVMISRQSNNISIDFQLLQKEFSKYPKMKIKILCKMIPKNFKGKVQYCFFIVKCMYYLAISNICIVDGYEIPVCALKHKKKLIVIQVWHAMGAIKKFGKQILNKKEGSKEIIADVMKMHQNYTYVTCTSHATQKFYAEAFGIETSKVLVLGMPRVDYILEPSRNIISEIKKQYPKLKEKKNILYVPTFRKGKSTYIHEVIEKVDTEKYNLIIRLHPLEHTNVNQEYLIDKKYNTIDLLKLADYIITDYSAIAFESAILNKPTFFYLYDIEEYENNRGLNINLEQEMKNCTSREIEKIISIIENNDYNMEELNKFREKYIETSENNNTRQIVEYVLNLIK